MPSAALGTKRECPKCGAKFYDLGADPVICPKCNHTLKADGKIKAKRAAAKRSNEPPKPKKAPPKPKAYDGEEHLGEIESGDEEIEESGEVGELEDLDELDDSPEVISLEEVEEHHEDSEADPNSDDAEDGMFIEERNDKETLFDPLDPDADEELDEEEEESDEDNDEDDDTASRKRKKK